MKIAVIGSREFNDYTVLSDTMDKWFDHEAGGDIIEIVSGGAIGADSLAAKWAISHDKNLIEFKPDWEKYGKRAGFIRNKDIIESSDIVLAFWDGASKGTANSLSIAKKLKKPTIIVYF